MTVPPGSYGDAMVNGGATLRLSTGRYLFTVLDIEPGAKVVLTTTSGPIEIFVKTSLFYRGTFSDVTGKPENLRITYLGTNAVALESSFVGRISTPNAALSLGATGGTTQTFAGLFFGKSIDVRPNAKVGCQATLAEGSALAERLDTSDGGGGCACAVSSASGGQGAGVGFHGTAATAATLSGLLAMAAIRRRRRTKKVSPAGDGERPSDPLAF